MSLSTSKPPFSPSWPTPKLPTGHGGGATGVSSNMLDDPVSPAPQQHVNVSGEITLPYPPRPPTPGPPPRPPPIPPRPPVPTPPPSPRNSMAESEGLQDVMAKHFSDVAVRLVQVWLALDVPVHPQPPTTSYGPRLVSSYPSIFLLSTPSFSSQPP